MGCSDACAACPCVQHPEGSHLLTSTRLQDLEGVGTAQNDLDGTGPKLFPINPKAEGVSSSWRYFLRPHFLVNETGMMRKATVLGLWGVALLGTCSFSTKPDYSLSGPARARRTNPPEMWAQGRRSPRYLQLEAPCC